MKKVIMFVGIVALVAMTLVAACNRNQSVATSNTCDSCVVDTASVESIDSVSVELTTDTISE